MSAGSVAKIDHQTWDSAPGQRKPSAGPRWIWLDAPQKRPDGRYFIPVCADIGWWGSDGPVSKPPAVRASVQALTIAQERADDGPPRWKVGEWAPKADANAVNLVSATWVQQCKGWATHTSLVGRNA